MPIRTDVTIDWRASPRIIEVAAPSAEITIYDLILTVQHLQWTLENDQMWGVRFTHILGIPGAEGNIQMNAGDTKRTGVLAYLNNAKVKFEDRGGPAYDECAIVDGTLLAVDSVGNFVSPIQPSLYTFVRYETDITAALLQTGISGLTPTESGQLDDVYAAFLHRQVLQEGSSNNLIIYEADGFTPRYTINVKDKNGNDISLAEGAPADRGGV